MTRTILVTGSSSGIGRASVQRFQKEGWNVIATMRAPERETELGLLDNTLVTRLDVTDEASIASAVAAGIARFGKTDVLLNNAGFGAYGPLEATPIETIRSQFETNVIGLYATTKAVLADMRARKSGLIINVSSMGGRMAFPLGSLYHGSKFAVEGLSEALAYELATIGITVKLIEPGMTRSDFAGRSFVFSSDAGLAEYAPVQAATMQGFVSFGAGAAEASDVAGTIFTAATDGTAQLRYLSGADAQHLSGLRQEQDDATLMATVRGIFGL